MEHVQCLRHVSRGCVVGGVRFWLGGRPFIHHVRAADSPKHNRDLRGDFSVVFCFAEKFNQVLCHS